LDKVTFHMGWIGVTLDPLRRERLIRMTCTFPWSGLDFVFAGVLHEKQFRKVLFPWKDEAAEGKTMMRT
jgi:hypothetical protein